VIDICSPARDAAIVKDTQTLIAKRLEHEPECAFALCTSTPRPRGLRIFGQRQDRLPDPWMRLRDPLFAALAAPIGLTRCGLARSASIDLRGI
jgi:hypothetical protein